MDHVQDIVSKETSQGKVTLVDRINIECYT